MKIDLQKVKYTAPKECEATTPEIYAIKALMAGEATKAQQLTVVDFLLCKACLITQSIYTGNDRDTTFLLGRQYVGYILSHLNSYTFPTKEDTKTI